jgi:triacylglycerol esterase/lipase EstA (alpha/beta hydrolase family)
MRKISLGTLASALVLLLPGPAAAAKPPPLPVIYSQQAGAAANPDASPPGANDWSCVPAAAHRLPVIALQGTWSVMSRGLNALAPALADAGYCVFAFNYGRVGAVGAIGDIVASARELSAFVDRVLRATGAERVDIVGHSQGGGPLPRYYLKYLGGAGKVRQLIGLSPDNHGSSLGGLARSVWSRPDAPRALASLGEALPQQVAGSPLLREINAGGDTVPGVRYTVIQTRFDEVSVPYTDAFLRGPDTTDITVQDLCPQDLSEHQALIFDHVAIGAVLTALDPAHPTPVRCGPVLPFVGG